MSNPIPCVDDYHDFISWLEEHNYCKVTRCAKCYFWGNSRSECCEAQNGRRFNRCRYHKVDTYHDDYCSDAVEVKK